jgi:hypothetical protein
LLCAACDMWSLKSGARDGLHRTAIVLPVFYFLM